MPPESNLFKDIVFFALSAVTIVAALGVIVSRDILRAALWLVGALAGVAGFFVLLQAEFLGIAQVLIYIGAIAVLIIFSIMVTSEVDRGNTANTFTRPALAVAAALFGALAYVGLSTDWPILSGLDAPAQGAVNDTLVNSVGVLGELLVTDWVLPFEVASALILAALIGALVLVRGQGGRP